MPGSRKGERRGGAKPKIVRSPKPPKPSTGRGFGTGGGRAKGTPNKQKPEERTREEVSRILASHRPVAQKEKMIEAYAIVTGAKVRMPKDVMLDAMRFFEENAMEWRDVEIANMERSAATQVPEARAVFESAVATAHARGRESLMLAVDVAYKVAPFVHPRLAAVMTDAGAGQNPMNAVAQLFRELDEAGRPAQYIDHDPVEVIP